MFQSPFVLLRLLPAVFFFVLLLISGPARAEDKIHPFTQQTYDQWLSKLTDSETASKPGGDPAKALPVLVAGEEWFNEKQKTLEKHPEYKTGLQRQLTLRLKQTRITAVIGLAIADGAVKEKKPELFDGKGGVYEQLDKADKLAKSIADAIGSDQPAVKDLFAYVEQVKGKCKEKADSMKVAGAGGGTISTVVPQGVKVDVFVKQAFEKWVANMTEDSGILAGDKPVEQKITELENGRRWYGSNAHQLKKHPNYEQGVPKMTGLMLGLAELKAKRAVEFAEKGLADMNPNMFSESSGTFQQFKEAERLVTEFGKGAEGEKVTEAITTAKKKVEELSNKYSEKSAASFKLPTEAYNGADKDDFRKQVIAKWTENYPGDKILGVRFMKANWERRKESVFKNGTWTDYDNSVLLVYVVIKKSDELATAYPAYVNKNNQTNAIEIGAQTKGAGYSHQDMLLKNVDF